MSAEQFFWKPWEKEIFLIMSNFSFSHSVFYPFGELYTIFFKFEIIICNLFQFGKSPQFVIWERVKQTILFFWPQGWTDVTPYHIIPTYSDHVIKPFENMVGKVENAGDQHFLLFPLCFYLFYINFKFWVIFLWLSANVLKFCPLVQGWISLGFPQF